MWIGSDVTDINGKDSCSDNDDDGTRIGRAFSNNWLARGFADDGMFLL